MMTTTFEDRMNSFRKSVSYQYGRGSKNISIDRKKFFSSVLSAIKNPEDFGGRPFIRYKGEQGIDCGGPSRDFFDNVGQAIMKQP